MILLAIAILPFIYVDVSVQARGFFQSDIEKQVVYIPLQGKIIYTSIHNGGSVNKGDTLLIIDTESIMARHASLLQSIDENESSMLDLEKLTNIYSLEDQPVKIGLTTQRYKAELTNFINQRLIQCTDHHLSNFSKCRHNTYYLLERKNFWINERH